MKIPPDVFIRGNGDTSRLRLPKVLAVLVALVLSTSTAKALAGTSHQSARRAASGVALARTARSGVADVTGGAEPNPAGPAGRVSVRPAAPGRPGVARPASGVASSIGATDSGAPTPSVAGPTQVTSLPTPVAGSLPRVAAVRSVRSADAVVVLNAPLTAAQRSKLLAVKGVAAVEEADSGTVRLAGAPAVAFGIDPGTFRAFTPPASAASNQLWQYVAAGSLVSSYEMASDRALKLGSHQTLLPAGAAGDQVDGWLGAFASIGLPGVDLLVSRVYSADLGLTPDSGLIVSAPDLPGPVLQSRLESLFPGAAIELLHADQLPVSLPGDVLNAQQRGALVAAALSRVGSPYVWGGAGPNVFDCSGLVQWSYRQAGIVMPRTAAEQYLTGDHIPLADAEPGDLLFWTYDPNDPGFIDHTAIYLGNGLMVVAPHTGLDVEVVPVPTNDFAGAVQVVLGG